MVPAGGWHTASWEVLGFGSSVLKQETTWQPASNKQSCFTTKKYNKICFRQDKSNAVTIQVHIWSALPFFTVWSDFGELPLSLAIQLIYFLCYVRQEYKNAMYSFRWITRGTIERGLMFVICTHYLHWNNIKLSLKHPFKMRDTTWQFTLTLHVHRQIVGSY